MDDPIKKEFPHNILRPKQDWSFIDKWFDDYGHTLEPREVARWAYSNGKWNKWVETLDGEVGEEEIKQMLNDIEYYQKRVEELEKTHEEWLMICKKCGDDLGIVYEPKKPRYMYVWRNHKGEVRFLNGLHELSIEYKYIGKIQLEME